MTWPRRRRNFETEMAEELRAHVAHRADDLEASGMDRLNAERQARIELGGIETHKEHIRDERLLGRTLRVLQQTANDLRLGARRLRHAPLYAIFAVGSIGVGAGVTTAMFAIVHEQFWASSGIRHPEAVAVVGNRIQGALALERVMSKADFEDYRAAQTSFDAVVGATRFSQSLSLPNTTQLVESEAVTEGYFPTLGVDAALGRVLQPADSRPDAPSVMVLSHRLWRTGFASDPNVVGQVVRLGGTPFEIVGVVARSYRGLNILPPRRTAAWIPVSAISRMPVYGVPVAAGHMPEPVVARTVPDRTALTMVVAGRLKDDVSLIRANAEAAAFSVGLDQEFPITRSVRGTRVPAQRQWELRSSEDNGSGSGYSPLIVVAIVALVLVVACTNLANLSLARGTSRGGELAVRLALGASRGRLIRELCAESLVVGAGGFVVAVLISVPLMTAASSDITGRDSAIEPHLSGIVIFATALAVGLSLLVCGLWPALRLSRADVRSMMTQGSAVLSPSWRTERLLIRFQTVVSVALFCSAAAFISALLVQVRADSGVDLDRLTIARTVFRLQSWDETRSRQAVDAIASVAPARFGFQATAVSSSMPFGGNPDVYANIALTPDIPTQEHALLIAATPGIFDALGLLLVSGRPFDGRDVAGADPVVVISEATALKLFGSRDVLGRDVYMRGSVNAINTTLVEQRKVIGVARDTDVGALTNRGADLVVVPLAQRFEHPNFVVARRDDGDTGDLRGLIRTADPDVAIAAAGPGLVMLGGPWAMARIVAGVALALGVLTVVMTMAGLFGVLTALVLRRSKEIGIRKALGADEAAIRRMVLWDGARPVASGTLIGLFLGVLVGFLTRAWIPEAAQPFPLVAALIIAVTVVPATLAACYFPARRAMRVDPNVTLKDA